MSCSCFTEGMVFHSALCAQVGQPYTPTPTASTADWKTTLPNGFDVSEAQKRKNTPVTRGFLWYFPKAVKAAARVSKKGNDKHNPGQPLHWAKEKSTDHEECIGRHLLDHAINPIDTDDDMPHLAKVFWRAGAMLETWLETPEGRAWFEKECGK